ncbi:Unsaturated chondroitin disaccharide hydrolase [Novipirellula aureliae]|uniref:Unsaturated chondroitin disaccharide hydrolase n=1 Tax=Novipirellula aureliae TaxID=2527966 RepID=A0A5C6E3F5_9BACT|nr:glycosyl hydrolase [Novipirellula aureliae]TWU43412.1 Unsaturated chondroitin disaccharide hydrolase [Novipirellula aureliae]
MIIDTSITPESLLPSLQVFWEISGQKITSINRDYDSSQGSPVFTIGGLYTTRGWTEWTQGFQYGSEILQFDASGDGSMLELGRQNTLARMAPHITHFGVHDHGFNNVSTYGNLLRLMQEGVIEANHWEKNYYELALMASGAVQAKRWTSLPVGGYIYSFNGPHSLFADTIRSLRALAVSHQLGHALMDENDRSISLLGRLVEHAKTTADYAVYYGEGRDAYDVRGRTAHESLFNLNDGNYRCPNSQQGFSPFTTWTRGLAWIIAGYPEQLEFLATRPDEEFEVFGGRESVETFMLKAARASCEFYIENSAADGIPYWDTGAPELYKLGDDYLSRPADPFNQFEPVDSSAAAIASQGLIRLGHYLEAKGDSDAATRYRQAGLTVLRTLLHEPYLSTSPSHQGLILHSVYHRPNGWDHIPEGQSVPCGESSMWGDYHAREVALYVLRMATGKPYYKFYLS